MRSRGVKFTNVFNFRDLGGYRTTDDRRVRWGRVFRADDLSRLGDADHDAFAKLGIRTVVDLRRPDEIDEFGRIPELDGLAYHHVHLRYASWPPSTFANTDERIGYIAERYGEMCVTAAEGLGQVLRLIADGGSSPLVFHCLAGKDRTGIVAALALSLLGVDDDVVAADYELSELAEAAAWEYHSRHNPDLVSKRWSQITVSPAGAMLALLRRLRSTHGSIAEYAESAGVTTAHVEAMREHLLADPSDPAEHDQDPRDHDVAAIQ